MAFYHKYRAKTFGEMVGQEQVTGPLLASIKAGKTVHAYLLTGPRGIGKTSVARLLAKAINCQNLGADGEPCNECDACKDINEGRSIDVTEIDAASHTGVDDVRDLIERVRLAPTSLKKKVYIIDEVHMLSKSAFNALLKTLEEPPAHAVFILATTETHKIPATILSRAQRYDFKRATKAEIIQNLKKIADLEKVEIDDDSLDLIAKAAAGGHRDAVSLFEKVLSGGKKLSIDKTRKILGLPEDSEVLAFLEAIFDSKAEEGLKIAGDVYQKGFDMAEFNRLIVERLRQILILKFTGLEVANDTKDNLKILEKLAGQKNTDEILIILEYFIEAGILLKDVAYPLLPIEMAVVKSTMDNESRIMNHEEERVIKKESENPRSGEAEKNQEVAVISNTFDSLSVNSVKNLNAAERSFADAQDDKKNDAEVPVPVLEMTGDIWQKILDETKKDNGTLYAVLRDAKPLEFAGKKLTLGFKFKFHKDKVSEAKNRELLENIAATIVGHTCQIECKISDGKPKVEASSPAEQVAAVEEVFEIE